MKREDGLSIYEQYYLRGYKEGLNKGMDYILERWRRSVDGLIIEDEIQNIAIKAMKEIDDEKKI